MAQKRAPSIKTLTTQLKDVDTAKAKLIRRILKAERRDDLLELDVELRHGNRDIHQCRLDHINESTGQLRAELLDRTLCTFGVEHCHRNRDGIGFYTDDQSGDNLIGKYLIAGDSYAPTLINTGKGWRVGCRADIVERHI